MPNLRKGLGRAVREARLKKGWSQEELAHLASLDRTYISGLERGTRNPALSTLERIAGTLNITVSNLLAKAEEAGKRRP